MSCIDKSLAPRSHAGGGPALAALAVLVTLAGCASRGVAPVAPAPATRTAPSTSATSAQGAARNWDEYRQRAAQRLVAANPGKTYLGEVPEPLLAIPVIEAELNADGSIARISVVRTPSQATETVQMAIDAMRRAAPFGDVRHLPRPWKYTEIFLYDDDHRFKPRTLDN